jgi:hypothetical protein
MQGFVKIDHKRKRTGTSFEMYSYHCSIAALTAYFIGSGCLVKPCDNNIKRAIELSQTMIHLADQGDAEREDIGCGVLYGVLRDSAYKILHLAEQEKKRHQEKGWWHKHCADHHHLKP